MRSWKEAFSTWSPAQSFKWSTYTGWASFVFLSGIEKTLMFTTPCSSQSPFFLLPSYAGFWKLWTTSAQGGKNSWGSLDYSRRRIDLSFSSGQLNSFMADVHCPERSLLLINCSSIDHLLQDVRGFYDVLLLEDLNAIGFCMRFDSSQGSLHGRTWFELVSGHYLTALLPWDTASLSTAFILVNAAFCPLVHPSISLLSFSNSVCLIFSSISYNHSGWTTLDVGWVNVRLY